MTAGYSGKPLVEKLGIKENMVLHFINLPSKDFTKTWGNFPKPIQILEKPKSGMDMIHFFTTASKEYNEKLPKLIKFLKPNGMIWISWPKKTSKIPSDMNENLIRDFALELGLVDVKVCAVDEVWSGLKLVIRKENR
ncbi:DUF3052 family protein [Leptospira meyeri]|uniref:Uncharacterized protein n=1 Tax=Leptospira meyeri TaxID=29508 RepID=A0A4V3HIS6_LEPME|nr:DUF3052 family protein [Leptospira meyeri]PKA24716.1 DUF3052 domain-containing protein [Leptospira sp. mixed culture ATI2-C-A1]EKJ86837.1 hypothetical protein LEP1GSC017_1871 [Leptospira meyeri serovar Hardjo str. Went 5]EMJ88094.1 hypothetical protein LEP1GSC196_1541 [Leptospira meyeri serovar Semaranga str. Veldrot Semarang 173]PJZ81325.1 DUF3052 domain-containing protein [Leptospira meyeri]PJZ96830.1 DUF3052 domain-containing protein [Leptospira meyeri]